MLQRSWMGRRVTVRRVVDRAADGSLVLGDIVGDLIGLDAQTAVIEGRSGPVEVPVAYITAARKVLPSTGEELALEAVAARGIRPAETEELGGWLLRADHGFLRRANSVLPLRQLGMPLDEAIERARSWYAERGLPLVIATQHESRRLLDADLGERGWDFSVESHLMTGRLDVLAPDVAGPDVAGPDVAGPDVAGPADDRVTFADSPDDDWLGLYRGGAGAGTHGRALLTRHDTVTFVGVEQDGQLLAIGRGVVDDGWLGVSGVEVSPDARRRGLATVVMDRLWRWGLAHGAARSYLQVEMSNDAAVGLYTKLGYAVHHDYLYRTDPAAASPQ